MNLKNRYYRIHGLQYRELIHELERSLILTEPEVTKLKSNIKAIKPK